jgi:Protein phosphatase 2C
LTNNDQDDLLIETAQNKDTFNTTSVNDMLSVRLLSVRSQEAQLQKLANQDYAQVYIQADGSSLCFCVCDGVGSSYKGDFAARYLARSLVEWMQNLTDLQVRTSALVSQLDARFNLWGRAAQKQLQQAAIPASTPALVREVLEDLRDTYGSETVFLCGRVDLDAGSNVTSAEDAGRLYSAEVLVCWMGNVTAQLFTAADEYVMLGEDDDRAARWSTLRGSRGPVSIWKRHLETIERLIVHTDGLDAIAASLPHLDDEAWLTETQRLLLLPCNDDMTALELRWGRHQITS